MPRQKNDDQVISLCAVVCGLCPKKLLQSTQLVTAPTPLSSCAESGPEFGHTAFVRWMLLKAIKRSHFQLIVNCVLQSYFQLAEFYSEAFIHRLFNSDISPFNKGTAHYDVSTGQVRGTKKKKLTYCMSSFFKSSNSLRSELITFFSSAARYRSRMCSNSRFSFNN
jgi:hypothetical protein